VFLLPHIEQQNVYRRFDFRMLGLMQFPPNDAIARERIALFECPDDGGNTGSTTTRFGLSATATNYVGNAGTWRTFNGVFRAFGSTERGRCVATRHIRDGLTQTAMMAESLVDDRTRDPRRYRSDTGRQYGPGERVAFMTACRNAALQPNGHGFGVPWLNGSMGTTRYNHVLPPNTRSCINGSNIPTGIHTPASEHPGGINLLLADGAVRFVSNSIDVTVWQALGSIHGREAVSSPW
jgi:hypothetical protein